MCVKKSGPTQKYPTSKFTLNVLAIPRRIGKVIPASMIPNLLSSSKIPRLLHCRRPSDVGFSDFAIARKAKIRHFRKANPKWWRSAESIESSRDSNIKPILIPVNLIAVNWQSHLLFNRIDRLRLTIPIRGLLINVCEILLVCKLRQSFSIRVHRSFFSLSLYPVQYL